MNHEPAEMIKQDAALVKFREIGELCDLHKLSQLGDIWNNNVEYFSISEFIFYIEFTFVLILSNGSVSSTAYVDAMHKHNRSTAEHVHLSYIVCEFSPNPHTCIACFLNARRHTSHWGYDRKQCGHGAYSHGVSGLTPWFVSTVRPLTSPLLSL